MHKLHRRLWIACSIFALAFASSHPVLAKSHLQSKVVASKSGKTSVILDRVSIPPIDAILAGIKTKQSPRTKVVSKAHRLVINRKSLAQRKLQPKMISARRVVHPGAHISADRSFQGIANFIESDRVSVSYDNFSAVNQLIE
jgi:hypothetical protein